MHDVTAVAVTGDVRAQPLLVRAACSFARVLPFRNRQWHVWDVTVHICAIVG